MVKPAIVVVGYNRPDGVKRLLDSIGQASYNCTDIPLIISIDESNRSNEVEAVAKAFEWTYGTKEIRRFPERQGLRQHIVQCGDYSEKYGAVIILEDDLIVAEDFYSYVCAAQEKYGEEEEVCGVSLYSFGTNQFTHYTFVPVSSLTDVYLGGMVVTWGQSWNIRQWRNFKKWYLEHEGKLPMLNTNIPQDISSWTRSWGRYFAYYIAEKHLYYVYPYRARTTCFSDFGEHNKVTVPVTFVQVPLMRGCPKGYNMGNISELVRYDSFYERVLTAGDIVCGIPGDEICMDLNNMKTIAGGKRYVITNTNLPYKEIGSFALTLRPASLNVTENVTGNQLHMFDMKGHGDTIRKWSTRPKYHADHLRIKYEFNDVSWRIMKFYSLKEFCIRAHDIIRESISKIIRKQF